MTILTCDACGYERSSNDDGRGFSEQEQHPHLLLCSECEDDGDY